MMKKQMILSLLYLLNTDENSRDDPFKISSAILKTLFKVVKVDRRISETVNGINYSWYLHTSYSPKGRIHVVLSLNWLFRKKTFRLRRSSKIMSLQWKTYQVIHYGSLFFISTQNKLEKLRKNIKISMSEILWISDEYLIRVHSLRNLNKNSKLKALPKELFQRII